MEYSSNDDNDYEYEEDIINDKLDMMTEDEIIYWNNIDKNEKMNFINYKKN